MSSTDDICLLVDSGSRNMKGGTNIDPIPAVVFPTVIGKPRRRYIDLYEPDQCFVGENAMAVLHHMTISNPIDHGHITDWPQMEKMWEHMFEQIGINPDGNRVLMTEPALCSDLHREKTAEIIFDTFNASELNMASGGLMSLYALGRTTGFIVDIGEGVTQCLPVFDGYPERSAIRRSDFGGEELTMYLQRILSDMGYFMTTRQEKEHVRKIKEQLCFCSLNPAEDEKNTVEEMKYVLPDGMILRDGYTTEIVLTSERFYVCEALFNPSLCARDNPPITELIWESLLACSMETRKTLLSSIIVSGGCSLFPGFVERLLIELKSAVPPQARSAVKIIGPDDRENLTWKGLKMFGDPSMKELQASSWITKEEWEEIGKPIVYKKAALKT